MRVKITLASCSKGAIDFNYQHQIQGLLYGFLARSNPDYSAWLHKQGFVYRNDKRFKFFVFSGITFHGRIKTTPLFSPSIITPPLSSPLAKGRKEEGLKRGTGGVNGFAFQGSPSNPFTLSFQIASPINEFIQHLIDGIFKEGHEIELGRQKLNVQRVETLPDPLDSLDNPHFPPYFKGDERGLSLYLKPLESLIFVKKPMPEGERDIYLFPGDKSYEELLNQNLIHKYETLYGKQYEGEPLKFDFKISQPLIPSPLRGEGQSLPPKYLSGGEGAKIKLVKSFKIFKDGKIIGEIKGTLQSFTVSGLIELIRIGLDCGFGQNNSIGCGYVEIIR